MARKRKPVTHEPDPLEQQMREETARALNAQFKGTFERIQHDYAGTGRRMAEAVYAVKDDQEFVDFLFGFYESATMLLRAPQDSDETNEFPQVMTTVLFMHKWSHQRPINVPCHVEDVLVGNRYLRRFIREFYRDIHAQGNASEQKQES